MPAKISHMCTKADEHVKNSVVKVYANEFVGCFLLQKKKKNLLTVITILKYHMISLPLVTLLMFIAVAHILHWNKPEKTSLILWVLFNFMMYMALEITHETNFKVQRFFGLIFTYSCDFGEMQNCVLKFQTHMPPFFSSIFTFQIFPDFWVLFISTIRLKE